MSVEKFKNAVELYLKNRQAVKLAMPKIEGDGLLGMSLYSRHRSSVFVFPTIHRYPNTQLGLIIPKWGETILVDDSLPARIEVYSSSTLTSQQIEEHKAKMRTIYNVELEIYDRAQLIKFEEFADVLDDGIGEFSEIDEASKMLFSLLAEGSNVSEIKSNLICSIIIFLLYEHENLTTRQLKEYAEKRLQHEIGSLQQEINFLLSKKRIEKNKENRELLQLSCEEKDNFLKIRKESKREESVFFQEFMLLLEKYNIPDGGTLIEQLKSLYVESCGINIDKAAIDKADVKRKDQVFQEFRINIKGYLKDGEKAEQFVRELKDICLNNPFLEKIGASEMFLSLYRSSKLEQFINSKKKYVYLDTRVFIFYYCFWASKGKKWPYWDDYSYRSTVNLASLANKKNKDIILRLADVYLAEIAGELQKALRTAWFDERIKLNLRIPFQTQNVFYNFYLFLRDSGALDTDKGKMPFVDFVKLLGFSNVNAEKNSFIKDTEMEIAKRLKYIGIELMSVGRFESRLYDDTIKEWDVQNSKKTYQKSGLAIKADTKQLLHIMFQPMVDREKEQEFYYASWDKSFRKMRDWVQKESLETNSFAIYNPARMANRFALSHFKIDSKCITHEVFYYADSHFKLQSKISSLYDHVLIPYFDTKGGEGLDLFNLLIDLQAKYLNQKDTELGDDVNLIKLPLELVFDNIKQSLKDWGCTESDLLSYMFDKPNENEVINTFEESFNAIAKNQKYDEYIKSFGMSLKSYVHKLDSIEHTSID